MTKNKETKLWSVSWTHQVCAMQIDYFHLEKLDVISWLVFIFYHCMAF